MGCVTAILKALAPIAPEKDWKFDLASDDKTLEYLGEERDDDFAGKVTAAVERAGFQCSRL